MSAWQEGETRTYADISSYRVCVRIPGGLENPVAIKEKRFWWLLVCSNGKDAAVAAPNKGARLLRKKKNVEIWYRIVARSRK
jgi:hypothetical protein